MQMESSPMRSVADFPVKMSVMPVQGGAWQASEAGCGSSLPGSFANWDLSTSSWKTSQLCLTGEWETFSEPFPTSGMMLSGRSYRAAPWVPHICDAECSLWPTPTASMDGRGFGIPMHDGTGRYKLSTVLRVQGLVSEHGWRIHPHFTETLMGLPLGWTEITQSETPFTGL